MAGSGYNESLEMKANDLFLTKTSLFQFNSSFYLCVTSDCQTFTSDSQLW